MALTKYKEKPNFKVSPESLGGKADIEELRFVIQKHDATRLHYDLRLEMEGVLKSWAVLKGPSTDPDVKLFNHLRPSDHNNSAKSFIFSWESNFL